MENKSLSLSSEVFSFMLSLYRHDSVPPTWACPGRTFTFISLVLLRPSKKPSLQLFGSVPPLDGCGRLANEAGGPDRRLHRSGIRLRPCPVGVGPLSSPPSSHSHPIPRCSTVSRPRSPALLHPTSPKRPGPIPRRKRPLTWPLPLSISLSPSPSFDSYCACPFFRSFCLSFHLPCHHATIDHLTATAAAALAPKSVENDFLKRNRTTARMKSRQGVFWQHLNLSEPPFADAGVQSPYSFPS